MPNTLLNFMSTKSYPGLLVWEFVSNKIWSDQGSEFGAGSAPRCQTIDNKVCFEKDFDI